jgi:hypothetical protein
MRLDGILHIIPRHDKIIGYQGAKSKKKFRKKFFSVQNLICSFSVDKIYSCLIKRNFPLCSRKLSYVSLGLTVSVELGCDSLSESHPNPTLIVKPKPKCDKFREPANK